MPECLDDFIDENNPVRVIDAFVDTLEQRRAEILACEQADITVTLPKPQRSGAKSEGRFGKQDFAYLADENVYRSPAGENLKYRFTAEEHGQKLHRYRATLELRTPPASAKRRNREGRGGYAATCSQV